MCCKIYKRYVLRDYKKYHARLKNIKTTCGVRFMKMCFKTKKMCYKTKKMCCKTIENVLQNHFGKPVSVFCSNWIPLQTAYSASSFIFGFNCKASSHAKTVSKSIELHCSIVWIFGSPQSKTVLKSMLVFIAFETTVLKPKEVLHVHVHAPLYQLNCIRGESILRSVKGGKTKASFAFWIVKCRPKRTATMYNFKKIFIYIMTISVFSYV